MSSPARQEAAGREVLHGIASRSTPSTLSLVWSHEDPATARHSRDPGSVGSPGRLWKGNDPPASATPAGAEGTPVTCSPAGNEIALVAETTAFDRDCLAAAANQPFTIRLDNGDSIRHNIEIYSIPFGWPGDVVPRSDVHGAKDEDIRRGRSAGRDVLLRLPSAHGHGRPFIVK